MFVRPMYSVSAAILIVVYRTLAHSNLIHMLP